MEDKESLRKLALYFNEKYLYKYLSSFKPCEVNIAVIGYNRLGRDIYNSPINDTIIRVSTLIYQTNYLSCEWKELKWEGSMHEWWQAVADNAKDRIQVAKTYTFIHD